ncbi:hypothetical protein Q0601_09630 [Paracoccus onubensis]|uniref:hypothetical protein n=1 Tax=Paracoccus onubensis TaxID=1675788 RepID=UPI00272FF765|nr:hypothetical protein [Paracoccus onubensis]MDP0927429.1 hypothetical protein [Paracoccus onubensis]
MKPDASMKLTTGRAACLSLVVMTAGWVFPVHAGNYTPPDGCKLEVTVQNRGCTVSQIFRCEQDPQGHQRSAIFDEEGLTYQSRIDAETRWIESNDPDTGIEDLLVEEAKDHASFSTLLETGRDDFDFWTESNTGERLHHVGQDELTGEKVTIDGIELEKTRFKLTTSSQNDEVLIEREGQQFINRAMGRFFGGVETMRDWTGQQQESNDSPVIFSFPGEDGFADTTPQFDCSEMLASGGGRKVSEPSS